MKLFSLVALALALAAPCRTQHYCWPCALQHGVVGKWTYASSQPAAAYNWKLK
jgi:hypothetical protein